MTALEITLDWPEFPSSRGVVEMSEESVISMPLDFWTLITEYVLDVRAIRAILEATSGGPITIAE